MYGEEKFFDLMNNKINRYSGKVTLNLYALDRANFLYMAGKVEESKFEFDSPEGLNHRIEYLEVMLLNIDGNKTQKEFFHTIKKTGDCKTTTKTKQF